MEGIAVVGLDLAKNVFQVQARPLEATYPLVFFDALRVKIRDEGWVRNKAVHIALRVRVDGAKEILGLWLTPPTRDYPRSTTSRQSATNFSNRAFASSSCFSRRISDGINPPYFLAPAIE
jgi:hypothetical protein